MTARHVRPEEMTARARAYLTITAIEHGLVGGSMAVLSHQFDGDGFRVARSLFPIWLWGLMFLAGASYIGRAAVVGEDGPARLGMILSVFMTAIFGASFALSYREGGVVSPVGTIFCLALMAKDLVVCAQPLRSPFERVVQEYDRTDEHG